MVYIAPGALVVGTPSGQRPRRADRELGGEQVLLEDFYVDRFPYPNEEGAIPQTSVSQAEAATLCQERGKRLCTELEWERACKGPDNRTYEYGERYDEAACGTGKQAELRPSGFHVSCQSDFGVRDLHGGPFEWTSSPFGRFGEAGQVALRGGNDPAGAVVGRCANVEAAGADTRSGTIGFRCCLGASGSPEVELPIVVRPGLVAQAGFGEELERSLIAALPEAARADVARGSGVRSHRGWLWRPVANEQLHLLALCSRVAPASGPRCGLLVARVAPGSVSALAWVSSGRWVANVHRPGPHDALWLVGGDTRGSFKRLLRYRFGDVEVGELSRGSPRTKAREVD
jgi:hypothetical protein